MMKRRVWAAAVMMAASLTVGYSQRTFTDVDGRTIDAEVRSVSETDVVLAVGKTTYNVPLERLVEEDREFLKSWRPAVTIGDPRIDVNFSDSVDRVKRNQERLLFRLEVEVRNADNREPFSGGTVDVLVLMRHLRERNVYGVGVRREFAVPAVPELRSTEVELPEFKHEHKGDGNNKKGWKFYGYVVILKDRNGKELRRSVSSAIDGELVGRLLKASEGDMFGRNYRPIDKGLRRKYDSNMLPEEVREKKEDEEEKQPELKDEPLVE
ncbi:hypothetical protein [Sulfuriroseicoccus oceanibius]|uniref:SLA1 homology domain-containing protein n=1 Tax=Sulfuriroseicoccus oceanibius TaxID=2707525 RepID=A0A6B3LCU8_9BACT|nr:hypothetical protein [Sulfuriroseicoccus oceanibius]QQL45710.1 hypothetical protein G3M56_003730 [Sulfuriroseicoccus oceanibius]